jgi:DNA polymerase-3 subunit alpha
MNPSGEKPFSHLHTHSHYSLLNALPKIPDLVGAAKRDNMKALALTDNANLYGAIEFYKECEKSGIKPIIGVDAYLALRSRFDKQAGVDNARFRLILLAKNEIGYKNLIELVTRAHLDGFYYKPRIDREILEKNHEGLICISPSFSGDIASAVGGSDMKKAEELAVWYKKVFGENFYIEITHHPEIDGHEEKMKKLVSLGAKMGIPLVATHDVYYILPEDRKARNTLISIQSGGEREKNGWGEGEDDFSFISQEQANAYFADLPEALDNVEKIVADCNLKLNLGAWVFPDFKVESGRTYENELRHIVEDGLVRHGLKKTPEIIERIEYELGIIKAKGYTSYFLVVADLLAYARKMGILTNTRGSAAGSMVSYLSGITTVNPIEFQIPFERFLNPDRPSPPDIDMDLADNRRDEIIAYVSNKYGTDKVAQIGTFGTMMARGAVRDVARALGYSYTLGDQIAKLIPLGSQGFAMTIDRAFEIVPELEALYKKEADVKDIIDMARKIEGCARHISVHAAGVVIAPTPLTDYTPVQFDPKGEGKIITQYDMYSIEDAGLLKFDFLGLKNLSIIADTVHRIEAIENRIIDIEIIPIDDKKTFELLARGETEALFQLNGDGMTKFLVDLKPTTIHDINAMVALYRPGPMGFIPDFILRKHNTSLIKYLDPALKPILEKTYGILVYQDDLLLIAKNIAGYTWGEVDKFRKAVGKKIPEEMEAQKEKFIAGCITHSAWSDKKAREVWSWIEPFAAYGFNKAHSVSYGRVAYQTAYLKAHFPAIYMSAALTADSGNIERIGEMINECKRMGIPVLPPNINESFQGFSVVREERVPDKIRFGLTTIKNFGEGIANTIIKERKAGGKFKSLADFLNRIRDRNLNKKSLEALIKSGALDEFGERGSMLENHELILEYHKSRMNESQNQDSLFGSVGSTEVSDISLPPAKPATMKDKLIWEKELLGLYISGHPLDSYREKLEKRDMNIAKIIEKPLEGKEVMLAGIIEEMREILTKRNERMVFLKIADLTGSIGAVAFPKTLETLKDVLKLEACIAFVGKVSLRNGDVSVLLDKAKLL